MARLTAFPWFGGKGSPKIQNAILQNLPQHTHYIEPFGGGASILLNKEPASVEVYNDLNRGLVNFFSVVADSFTFPQFFGRVSALPFARDIYEEYNRTWPGGREPLEQAVRWYYVARQSFSGLHGNSWGATVQSTQNGMASAAARWQTAIERLPAIHARLRSVEIECCDAVDALRRYCGPGWLAYCDPPYVSGARKAGGYQHELTNADHGRLIQALMAYDGAVILSGYRSPLYEPLKKAGWDSIEIDVVCSAAGRTRNSGLQGQGNAKKKQGRLEVIWRNPETIRRFEA
jgi:DNA adenine methylase